MYSIQATNYTIEIGSLIESSLSFLLSSEFQESKKIILVDENSKQFCLEYLITSFQELAFAEIVELPAGEEYKQLEMCVQVWEALTEYHIDRKALIINLGGGVITDMGGLIASLYKRGISFINIPTTLLAMVDASVGGKTGVDLGIYKNQVGLFTFPKAVFIDPGFLHTLDALQIKNGLAEMLKHGLICDFNHWKSLKTCILNSEDISDDLIKLSVDIKNQIVISDPFEANERKKLNFGHTIGHAIESFYLEEKTPILHGFAIAAGIQIENYISLQMNLISLAEYDEINQFLSETYPKLNFTSENFDQIISNTKQDKKNSKNQVMMVLLKSIGTAVVDVPITEEMIKSALNNYLNS